MWKANALEVFRSRGLKAGLFYSIGEAWTPPPPLETIPQQWKDWPRPFPADRKAESLTLGQEATVSNVYQNHSSAVGQTAVDGDPTTRCSTDGTQSQAALTVDLGTLQHIGQAYLSEPYGRVGQFELQYVPWPLERRRC